MTDQYESPHAALLRDLDSAAAGVQRLDRLDAESTAVAIRALEAKVKGFKWLVDQHKHDADELRAERDRLAGEVGEVRENAATAMRAYEDMRKQAGRLDLECARLTSELAAAQHSLKYCRQAMTYEAELKEQEKEFRKTAEAALAAARENEARYLWLRSSDQEQVEVFAHYTLDALDAAIDAARRAGDASEAGSIRQSRKGEK